MLLSNLAGVQFGGAAGGGFVPMMPLYGNPGDYAWGRGGLDAVVTSLLNQVRNPFKSVSPYRNSFKSSVSGFRQFYVPALFTIR
jgi:hypothetical protein